MKMQCIESIKKNLNLGDLQFEERPKLICVTVRFRWLISWGEYHHAA
jgi:hypothetical protein